MDERPTIDIPNADWLASISKQTRDDQVERDSAAFKPPVERPHPITGHPVAVMVTGPSVDVGVADAHRYYSGYGNIPQVYPAVRVYRNTNAGNIAYKYYHKNEKCWLEEYNNHDLTTNKIYQALLVGMHNSLALFATNVSTAGDNTGSGSGGILVKVVGTRTQDSTGIEYIPVTLVEFSKDTGDILKAPPFENYRWLMLRDQDAVVGTAVHQPWPHLAESMFVKETGESLTLNYGGPIVLTDFTNGGGDTGDATHAIVEWTRIKEKIIILTVDSSSVLNVIEDSPAAGTAYFAGAGSDQIVYLLGAELVDAVFFEDPPTPPVILFWLLPRYQPAITGIDTIEPLCVPGKAYNGQYTGRVITFDVRVKSQDVDHPYDPDDPLSFTDTSMSLPLYETRDFPCGVAIACGGEPSEETLYLGG